MAISDQTKKHVMIGLLIFFIILNLSVIGPEMGSFGLGILTNLNHPGIWRSARFAWSSNFADYILFLREEIPADGTVFLPPKKVSNWALSDTPTMQYFLAPRKIRNCTTLECGKDQIGRDNIYILVMGLDRFPGSIIRSQEENIRMYNDTWGVYGPVDGLGKGDQIQHLSLITNIGIRVLFPLFSILLFMIIGYYLGSLMVPGFPPWARLGLGTGIFLGVLSLGGYLLLYLDLIKDLGVIFTILSGVTVIFLILAVAKKKLLLSSFFDLFSLRKDLDLWTIIILLLGGGVAFLSVGAGFHETDAYVLWGAKAVGLVADGLSGVTTWGTNTTVYPLHIPMLLGMLMDTFGDSLPASKIIFPIYYLSLILVVYGFLKRTGDRVITGLGTLVLATMPFLAHHALIGYANLPLTFYLVTGVIFVIQAASELNQKTNRWLWLGAGIMFAFASWTRPEGFWLVAGGMIFGFCCLIFSGNLKQIQQPLFITLPPVLLLWVVWKLTSR